MPKIFCTNPIKPSKTKSNNMKKFLKSFWSDESGNNGIEFAIVAPFLILLLTGIIWITDTERVSTQASLVSSTVSDIIARAETVTEDTIDKTLYAADAMMSGRGSDLQIFVAGIENQATSTNPDGTSVFQPVVIWVRERNIQDLTVPSVGDVYNINQSLVDNVPFVVTSKVRYKHTPAVGPDIMGQQVYEYEHTFAPRADLKTDCEDC